MPPTGLDDGHWLRLWRHLAAPEDVALATDKLALAERVRSHGARIPPILLEIPKGGRADLAAWPWDGVHPLLVKPRHGSRGGGVHSIQPVPGLRAFLVRGALPGGGQVYDGAELEAELTALARRDALLVQPLLRPASDLADLSPDAPIELRLTTARPPGGRSRVVACYAKIQPRGAHASTILNHALGVPLDPETGIMEDGVLGRHPECRLAEIPWSGLRVSGRKVPQYAEAAAMVERAAEALPGLPVIGWDVLLTEAGPVVLEANSSLSWSLIHLRLADTGRPSPLLPLVLSWIEKAEQGPIRR